MTSALYVKQSLLVGHTVTPENIEPLAITQYWATQVAKGVLQQQNFSGFNISRWTSAYVESLSKYCPFVEITGSTKTKCPVPADKLYSTVDNLVSVSGEFGKDLSAIAQAAQTAGPAKHFLDGWWHQVRLAPSAPGFCIGSYSIDETSFSFSVNIINLSLNDLAWTNIVTPAPIELDMETLTLSMSVDKCAYEDALSAIRKKWQPPAKFPWPEKLGTAFLTV